jgi:hypothetical protein
MEMIYGKDPKKRVSQGIRRNLTESGTSGRTWTNGSNNSGGDLLESSAGLKKLISILTICEIFTKIYTKSMG